MTATRARIVLKVNALFDFGAGLLMLTGTWNGLWEALELPQGRPAIFVQIGGAGLWGLAYVMSRAADEPAMRAPVALGAALADGLAAAVIVVWLVSGKIDYLDALGTTLLVLIAVVLAVFTVLKALVARDRPGPEELRRSG